ncbi:MAG: SEC-C metal-binding domain-containing protein [Patescibacteria group bacterium]|nr:SEC-C metal-binding domain-containing protein [Patescibacteria group bacterium]
MTKYRVNEQCPCGSQRKYKKCCKDKPKDPSEAVAKFDWRHRAVTAIAQPCVSPLGKKLEVGDPVVQISRIKMGDKIIGFGAVSAPALFLSLSKKAHLSAVSLLNNPNLVAEREGAPSFAEAGLLFDFFEQMMAAVVFSYTSIESFTNIAVPEGFLHEEIRTDGRCTERYDKSQIERNLKLSRKLELLPNWLEDGAGACPKGTLLWDRFKKLETLRDRIIHLKSVDLKNAKGDDPVPDSIWQELIQVPETYQVAFDLQKHYVGNKCPRWMWKFEQDS